MEKSRARWIVQANNQRYLNLFLRPFSHELRVTKPNEVRQRKAAVFQSRNRLTEIYGGLRHGRLVPISLTLCNRNELFQSAWSGSNHRFTTQQCSFKVYYLPCKTAIHIGVQPFLSTKVTRVFPGRS